MKTLNYLTSTIILPEYLIGKIIKIKKNLNLFIYSVRVHENFNIKKIYITNSPKIKNSIYIKNDPLFQINDIIELTKDNQIILHISTNSNDNSLLVNNHCNLNCINCPQIDKNKIVNLPKKNFEIIDLLNKNITQIGLTGGEPTLDINYLIEIMNRLHSKNKNLQIDILTNAMNIYKNTDLLNFIIEKQIDVTFCIALYADIAEIHDRLTQKKGSFWDTIKSLHYLAAFNQKIELRFIINKLNYIRLPSFIIFCYDNLPYIKRLALIGMEYSGEANKNAKQLFISQYNYNIELIQAIKFAKQRNLPIYIFNHQVCKLDKKIWEYCVPTISDWKTHYLPECKFCVMRDICGGFFATSNKDYLDTCITPINYKVKGL